MIINIIYQFLWSTHFYSNWSNCFFNFSISFQGRFLLFIQILWNHNLKGYDVISSFLFWIWFICAKDFQSTVFEQHLWIMFYTWWYANLFCTIYGVNFNCAPKYCLSHRKLFIAQYVIAFSSILWMRIYSHTNDQVTELAIQCLMSLFPDS